MTRSVPTNDEIAAENICCTYLDHNKNTLNLSDLPDLQDLTNDVGIEVRNVFDPVAGKIKAYLKKNFNTQKTLKEKVGELKKMHIDDEIIYLGFAHVFVDERLKNVQAYFQHRVDTFGDAYAFEDIYVIDSNFSIMKFLPSPYKSALFENAAELSCPGGMFLVSVPSLFLHSDAVRQAGRPLNHISELTAPGVPQEMLYIGERLNPVGESRLNYGDEHCRGPPQM